MEGICHWQSCSRRGSGVHGCSSADEVPTSQCRSPEEPSPACRQCQIPSGRTPSPEPSGEVLAAALPHARLRSNAGFKTSSGCTRTKQTAQGRIQDIEPTPKGSYGPLAACRGVTGIVHNRFQPDEVAVLPAACVRVRALARVEFVEHAAAHLVKPRRLRCRLL